MRATFIARNAINVDRWNSKRRLGAPRQCNACAAFFGNVVLFGIPLVFHATDVRKDDRAETRRIGICVNRINVILSSRIARRLQLCAFSGNPMLACPSPLVAVHNIGRCAPGLANKQCINVEFAFVQLSRIMAPRTVHRKCGIALYCDVGECSAPASLVFQYST